VADSLTIPARFSIPLQLAIVAAVAGLLMTAAVWRTQDERPVRINVRWTEATSDSERRAAEATLRLSEPVNVEGSTWQYTLTDLSRASLERIVRHPAADDTHGIDRSAMVLVSHDQSDEAQAQLGNRPRDRIVNAFAAAREHPAMPVVLVLVLCGIALLLPMAQSLGSWVARLVPDAPVNGFDAYRAALGIGLAFAVWRTTFGSETLVPAELQRQTDWFAQFAPFAFLVQSPSSLAAIKALAIAAFLFFAAGVAPRPTLTLAAVMLTVLVLTKLRVNSSHDWGLPLVTVLSLLTVRWRRTAEMTPSDRGLAIWLPGALLGVAFCAAGIAKLRTSGFDWITTGAVRYHFVQDAESRLSELSLWIAAHETAAIALSAGIVALELSFLLAGYVRDWRCRAVIGVAAVMTLFGFNIMQGVFWPAWWVLLISFVPWSRLPALVRQRTVAIGSLATVGRSLTPAQARVLAALVLTQTTASAAAIEVEPFVSNYPMYSWTYESPAAFNAAYEANSRSYSFYLAESSGCARDITAAALDAPNVLASIVRLVERVEQHGVGSPPEVARAAYTTLLRSADVPLNSAPDVIVVTQSRTFDFASGVFRTSPPKPVARFIEGQMIASAKPVRPCGDN
jgi:hypothetical protein